MVIDEPVNYRLEQQVYDARIEGAVSLLPKWYSHALVPRTS